MNRFFNIAGPCFPEEHYTLPPLERLPGLLPLIHQKQYFVIHAARQTGKTTLLQHLAAFLNQEGKYYAAYCPLEAAQVFPEPKEGMRQIFYSLSYTIKHSGLPEAESFGKGVNVDETSIVIKSAISGYCSKLDKPLVLLFDEIDTLQNETLAAFLNQLWESYGVRYPISFPHSVMLMGMRNILDPKSKLRGELEFLSSAGSVVVKALHSINFSRPEIAALYRQHTEATDQAFEPTAVDKAYEYSGGHPWLANAIARETVEGILNGDYSQTVTPQLVEQAARNIISRRDTHIDSLLDRLKEERVRKVLYPLIAGNTPDIDELDIQYCIDLGLIKTEGGRIKPTNLIYHEIMKRELSRQPIPFDK